MYATVRRYTANSGSVRDAARRIDGFLPIVSAIPGFVSYVLLEGEAEHGHDVLVTVTTCETRAGVDESVKVAANWVKDNLAGLGLSAPIVTTGEVLASAGKVK